MRAHNLTQVIDGCDEGSNICPDARASAPMRTRSDWDCSPIMSYALIHTALRSLVHNTVQTARRVNVLLVISSEFGASGTCKVNRSLGKPHTGTD